MKLKSSYLFLLSLVSLISCLSSEHKQYSGIYPHLAYYNTNGECGTGAVVPWMNRLWVVTYSPHEPYGSDDKLYEISPSLDIVARPESIGGTNANRMIHKQSNQLFIGPYVIDSLCNVRTFSFQKMPGRYTGFASHLSDPEHRILLATMEAGFYDIAVDDLSSKELFKDGNVKLKEGESTELCSMLPGYHGKGFYSSQGVAVYSNNGEEGKLAQEQFDIPSGSLSEWDGKTWKVIRRNQFTEITGPGGIFGNDSPSDPIWSLGWDYRSVILAVREIDKGWSYYRLPKASYSYDGAHGWNTEWPRIRNVGNEYLMTMHGMFWHFPGSFSSSNSKGIRPRGSYLKVIGDFCNWNNQLVFGCDDAAAAVFLNKRSKHTTNSGQSNSNLWFTSLEKPDDVGPVNASGSVWLKDTVKQNVPSDPFIFDGWEIRSAWIANNSSVPSEITFEVDLEGTNSWSIYKTIKVDANSSLILPFDKTDNGVWIRAKSSQDIIADLTFTYAEKEKRSSIPDSIFNGLQTISNSQFPEVLLYGLSDNRKSLGVLKDDSLYFELDEKMDVSVKSDDSVKQYMSYNLSLDENPVTFDGNSVLIVDGKGRRWRLPHGDMRYFDKRQRICREVVTERSLLSISGTFYELPAENADGYAKIRPVSSHNFSISDYTSYRGMLIMSGDITNDKSNPNIVSSKGLTLWAGAVDDLWKLGKPIGEGGPWYKSDVIKDVPSDPYLIGFYDDRTIVIKHESDDNVTFTIEADPTGDGRWFSYAEMTVGKGQLYTYHFPDYFQARWIRLVSDKNTNATITLVYK